jgi:hypothetical protein
MIKRLNQLHLEPQAIDQPLDLSVPENKMMLAFYLASPEVENDRRALNVISGQRRARKSGRFTQPAPFGYMNRRDEELKAIIIPNQKEAPLVKESFTLLASGSYAIKEVWFKMKTKGMRCSLNQFHNLIRNKVYTGQIFVPAWKDEVEEWVKGIHEPLIDNTLFIQVQNVLNGKKIQHIQPKNKNAHELPLRGLLVCRKCGENITGSGSRGNGGRLYYYHCRKGCKERFRADTAHESLLKLLRSIQITSEAKKLYTAILKDLLGHSDEDRNQ